MAVYKHRNGRWYYNFMQKGKRYHGACEGCFEHKDALELERDERRKIALIERGLAPKEFKEISLSVMVKKYLEYSKINKNSYDHDVFYTRYWLEFFGNKSLDKIKSLDIENYKKIRLEKVASSTVNRELNSLSKMFSIAVDNDYLPQNPCGSVKKLRIKNKKIRFLAKEEQESLLKVVSGHWIEPIIQIALLTGMRQGEILNLRWPQIDFKKGYIELLETKNNEARKIPISNKLNSILGNLARLSDEFVFVNPKTKNRHSNIKDVFPEFLKKAEIKNFVFHDLRHTAATRMVESGIDLVVVKDIMGHKDIKTTMIYSHPVPERKLKAIEALDSYI